MKPLCIILMCLSALPLLIYPILLMASVMSLMAPSPATPVPIVLMFAAYGALWGAILYPVPCLISLIASAKIIGKGDIRKALYWQLGVLGYISFVLLLFMLWWVLV